MWNIAFNTFREIIRNKFLSLIVFFGAIFLLISLLLRTLALGEIERMLYDFGLSFIELTGFLIVLFLGGGMLYREIEGRTIYLLLSKPINRSSILIGKFFGFAMILLLITTFLSAIFYVLIVSNGFHFDPLAYIAIVGIYLKLISLLAVILFFSTVASPILSMFCTIAAYFIGHNSYVILDFSIKKGNVWFEWIGRATTTLFPNLEALNIKNYVATGFPIEPNWIMSFSTSILYIIVILFLGVFLFKKKSFDTV